ncbi:MAG: RluA family pseudouridine synthase [Verrucomicrobiota bacterium]
MDESTEYQFLISSKSGAGDRLDRFLAAQLAHLSRSRLQQLIRDENVQVDGQTSKPKARLTPGSTVSVSIPAPVPLAEVEPQDIPLQVIYEDQDFIVINKAHGIVVHPAAGNPDGTLVNALLHHCQGELSGIGGVQRPGIVHRLDKDTSGCLVAAKNDAAHQEISRQFADRETTKIYHCVVQGIPVRNNGSIENHIGRHPVNRQKMAVLEAPKGKHAHTDYKILRTSKDDADQNDKQPAWALIECHLHTGRTHQIRVHMKSLSCPILGDEIYAQISRQQPKVERMLLHASHLGFTHPRSKEALTFTAPLPKAFSAYSL